MKILFCILSFFIAISQISFANEPKFLYLLGYENVKPPTEELTKIFSLKEIASLSDVELKTRLSDISEEVRKAPLAPSANQALSSVDNLAFRGYRRTDLNTKAKNNLDLQRKARDRARGGTTPPECFAAA